MREVAFDTRCVYFYLSHPARTAPAATSQSPRVATRGLCSTSGVPRLLSRSRILIVDPSAENREVLRTLLQRRGAETLETAHLRHACRLAQQARPDVIVCDGEGADHHSGEAIEGLGRIASRNSTPIVVLGTLKRQTSPLAKGHFVSKPYHYAALIRRIEELLGNRA